MPPAPTADFTANVIEGFSPLTVQFTDQSTTGVTSWLWDFGDTITSTEQNPQHTYTYPGWFTVSLTVTKDSLSDTETKVNYIKANLTVRKQKANYIFITPTLKTFDIAPSEERLDLRIATLRGNANTSLPEQGVTLKLSGTESSFASGFERPQGPSLLFD